MRFGQRGAERRAAAKLTDRETFSLASRGVRSGGSCTRGTILTSGGVDGAGGAVGDGGRWLGGEYD